MVDVTITGHRPSKLPHDRYLYEERLSAAFDDHNVTRVIQGMADGVDLISAKVAYKTGRPFIAVRPGPWHKPRIPEWQSHYDQALKYAQKVEFAGTEEKYPGPWAFQRRNEYMVDKLWPLHGDFVIAIWDGSASGTGNCVTYALEKNIRVLGIDPNTLKEEWIK